MDVRHVPNQTEHWNRILIRFLLLFAFWVAISFPLRMLFFGKFYHNPDTKSLFFPMNEVYWIGPLLADFLQSLFLSVIYGFAEPALPKGLLGGFIFGIAFAIVAYVSPAIYCYHLTQIQPAILWWVWAGYMSVFAILGGVINSIGREYQE